VERQLCARDFASLTGCSWPIFFLIVLRKAAVTLKLHNFTVPVFVRELAKIGKCWTMGSNENNSLQKQATRKARN